MNQAPFFESMDVVRNPNFGQLPSSFALGGRIIRNTPTGHYMGLGLYALYGPTVRVTQKDKDKGGFPRLLFLEAPVQPFLAAAVQPVD